MKFYPPYPMGSTPELTIDCVDSSEERLKDGALLEIPIPLPPPVIGPRAVPSMPENAFPAALMTPGVCDFCDTRAAMIATPTIAVKIPTPAVTMLSVFIDTPNRYWQ